MAKKQAVRYNVFTGSRLFPSVTIKNEGDIAKLEGLKPHHRWQIRKDEIVRKIKLPA